jgi:hypothetical protein
MVSHKETQKAQEGNGWDLRPSFLRLLCFSWPPIFSQCSVALCLVLICAVGSAQEESGGSAKQPRNNAAGKKAAVRKDAKESPITAEKEAAVNAFVAEHHPELGELLRHLAGMKNQRPYGRAIRELSAASERLANLQKTDEKRYDLELKSWKVKSRIQLLSARLTMKDDEQLKTELKAAISEQYDLRREIMTAEKDRIQDRLQKLERDLASYDQRREAEIEKHFKQLTSVPKSRPAAKGKNDQSTRSKSTTGS